MTAPFQSQLWDTYVFQLAERYEFITSALVALSSVHETFSCGVENRTRSQADVLRYYTKTIRGINQSMDAELSIDAVLMTILILHTLDSMRSYFQNALQHAQAGIKIIRERLSMFHASGQTLWSEAMHREFLAMQNQVREFGNSGVSKAFDALQGFEPPSCDQFNSVEEALYHLGIVFNEMYCLSDYLEVLQSSKIVLSDVFVRKIQPRYKTVILRFKSWKRGLQHLNTLLSSDYDHRQSQACLVLSMYESLFNAMLESFPSGICFDRFDADLSRALDLAHMFIERQASSSTSHTDFSLSLGIIPGLFVIAWRSNDNFIRDKSLELLRRSDRREGVWDSKVAFQIVQRYIALKTASIADTPGGHVQISEIFFDSDTTCQLVCCVIGSEIPLSGELLPFEGLLGERRCVETIQLGLD
ncbi:hypothetical protein LTR84_000412 [Exophiala bonariae]|uniref:Transcription factor domain-containing protein n=1 Tax=Exophiala bonariae TaxID=1690606 RepID=A0AAV9NS95_9EURO|nr:hypothetical protein LTR84_000412 [Exophiala bonariae]